eukprot:1977330-Pleurochrysis_carterae.AAC.1
MRTDLAAKLRWSDCGTWSSLCVLLEPADARGEEQGGKTRDPCSQHNHFCDHAPVAATTDLYYERGQGGHHYPNARVAVGLRRQHALAAAVHRKN